MKKDDKERARLISELVKNSTPEERRQIAIGRREGAKLRKKVEEL